LDRAIEWLVGAEVHEGEWHLVLLFFANLFLLLSAYYILKVIREPLILLGGSAVSRSYAHGLQAALLAVIIPLYSAVANRFEPDRLVKWVIGLFVACLLLFFMLGSLHVNIGFAFFVWLGIFSTLSIAQFWSLAVDLMTEAQGKRLLPMIAAGGTLGGIVGAQVAARAIRVFQIHDLMLIAAAALAGCMFLTHISHGAGLRHRERASGAPLSSERDPRGAFTLVVRDRYLLLIGLCVFVLNLISTNGDFILAQLVNLKAQTLAAPERQRFVSAFYGNFHTYVSVLTAVGQIVIVGRVFKAIGVAGALFCLPVIAVTGYGASAVAPALALVATVRVLENSTDYSLQNTIQQALFLPTSRDAKYKAKSAIDTFSVRLGDLASTGLVFLGVRAGMATLGFAAANVVAALLWIGLVVLLRRHRVELVAAGSTSPSEDGAAGEALGFGEKEQRAS
jgi:AAA family ATP:ADP antiporter